MTNLIVICCVCNSYKDNTSRKWYSSVGKDFEGMQRSHGYCGICFRDLLLGEGVTESEIEKMVKSAEEIK